MATYNSSDDIHSVVSWGAVVAGAAASVAITLVMVAFGVGVGFSVVSPWAEKGITATFTIPAGVYLIASAMIPAVRRIFGRPVALAMVDRARTRTIFP